MGYSYNPFTGKLDNAGDGGGGGINSVSEDPAPTLGGDLDCDTFNINLKYTRHADNYGVIQKEGNRFIHDFNYGDNGTVTTEGRNTFIGEEAGNFSSGSSASYSSDSSDNTGAGYRTLRLVTTGKNNSMFGALTGASITSGYLNTGIGGSALYSLISGTECTVIGADAGFNATEARSCVAVGARSQWALTDARMCIGIGAYSLYANQRGWDNVAIGDHAMAGGNHISFKQNVAIGTNAGYRDGSGHTCNRLYNTIYIGHDTKASSQTAQEEIVIGPTVTGLGSNTTVIGNKTERTMIRGMVGCNTDSPHSYCHSGGSFAAGIEVFKKEPKVGEKQYTIVCNTSGADMVVDLPSASGIEGRVYNIKNVGNSKVFVRPAHHEYIDQEEEIVLAELFDSLTIQANRMKDFDWVILAFYNKHILRP